MKALVTGGLGFIGINLVLRLLDHGHEVAIIDDASRPGVRQHMMLLGPRENVVLGGGSISGPGFLEGMGEQFDVIFHLAAQTAVTTSLADPLLDFHTNALGTIRVLEYARHMDRPPIVLFTSTNKVYGDLAELDVCESATRYDFNPCLGYAVGVGEEQPLSFLSPYGCSKGCADQYVLDYHRIYSLPTIVFRMSCIYGPHQLGTEDQGWIHHIAKSAIEGKEIRVYGNGKQVRDALYVDDLIEAMLLAVAKIDVTRGQVYNIGGGPANTVSVNELAAMCGLKFEAKGELTYHPERPGDQKIYVSDIRKAARDFGWEPKVGFPEGLKRMVDSWAEP